MTTNPFGAPNGATITGDAAVVGTFSATRFVGPLAGNASSVNALAPAQNLVLGGVATGSLTLSGAADATMTVALAATGVTAGSLTKPVVNSRGWITQGGSLTKAEIEAALGFTTVNNATAVTSVAGRTGAVTLAAADVTGALPSTGGTISNGLVISATDGAIGGQMVLIGASNGDVRVSAANGLLRIERASDGANRFTYSMATGDLSVPALAHAYGEVTATTTMTAGNSVYSAGYHILRADGAKKLSFQNSSGVEVGSISTLASPAMIVIRNGEAAASTAFSVNAGGDLALMAVSAGGYANNFRMISDPDTGFRHISANRHAVVVNDVDRWQVNATGVTMASSHLLRFGPSGSDYCFTMQSNGNLVLYTVGDPTGSSDPFVWHSNTATSDARLKTQIKPVSGAAERVALLHPLTFQWKAGSVLDDGGKTHAGFVAQELEVTYPEAVTSQGGEDAFRVIDKTLLIPDLVMVVQELYAALQVAKLRLARLEAGH